MRGVTQYVEPTPTRDLAVMTVSAIVARPHPSVHARAPALRHCGDDLHRRDAGDVALAAHDLDDMFDVVHRILDLKP